MAAGETGEVRTMADTRPLRERARHAWRRTGADVPYGDPLPTHGAEMEGWFWRISHPGTREVVVALCGVNRSAEGSWATVALAATRGDLVHSAVVEEASADDARFDVRAGETLVADDRHLRVRFGDDLLDVTLHDQQRWARRLLGSSGLVSMVPRLNQYWHPWLFGARVEGRAVLGGEEVVLDGATAYAEKNWGAGFPEHWWWGQAQGFDRPDVCVAFSGGRLALGPVAADVSGIVVRVGDEWLRLAPPSSRVRVEVGDGTWRLRGRSLRGTEVRIEGDGNGSAPHVLPVPLPAERRNVETDFEHLAGTLHLTVRRAGRTLFEGTSTLAGLEVGSRP